MKILLAVSALLLTACSTPEPAPTAEDAFRFGGISMPASGKVLETKYDRGIDSRYVVVLALPAEDVPRLLDASQFDPGVMADDRIVDGRRVVRKVTVQGTTVHLELFTT
ncbi:hypothetical protein P3102_32470 [Amycolatopsis sp. QT-25]|uniref:hypothetical protein n=1 Tax=Amycolatopsis sp. QT-25 TaxID=3034022 RepID=UPI0023EE2631|nr:hypothetical protein [Amycolatopsis sp. QT-25]WET78714.1 hypothetical protein P3102_32470 [Amycolatopsis sp. QT-25]